MRLTGLAVLASMAMIAADAPLMAQEAVAGLPASRDFSGVWVNYRAPEGSPPAARVPQPSALPLTEEGQRLREEYEKLMGESGDNAASHCVVYGMPTMMQAAGGYPIEFIHRPEQLTIIYEVESETRRVYMPQHSGIPPEKRLPVRQGYSEGRWEGDTLVVTTTDMNDGFDQRSYPHSDQAVIVERFRMVTDEDVGRILEYEMTMTDPVYYTEPVSFEKRWTPLEDGYIMAYNCTEEAWLRLLEARRAQLQAGEPVTARMSDVIDVYE
jgi:hypothetical protein